MPHHETAAPHTPAPLVSFVVTAYNLPADLLTACIRSILALSLSRHEREIIVVDDGSTPPAIGHLADMADDIVYLRQPNGGVSTARNTGLDIAKGTYLQFVDGDDCLVQNNYEHCLDTVRYAAPDIVMFDFARTTDVATDYTDQPPTSGQQLLRSQNIHGAAWGYLFRRTVAGALRFTPGVAYGEDEEFTPQLLLRAETVVVTTAKAYCYRERATSAIGDKTAGGVVRRLDDVLGVISRLHTTADTLPTNERLGLQRRVAQLTMDYLYNVILLTRDRRQLQTHIEELRRRGLFPLPDRDYTTKYAWFRRLANTQAGLSLLLYALPRLGKER